MLSIEKYIEEYIRDSGVLTPESVCELTASGSARRYFRISWKDDTPKVMCLSGNVKENSAFCRLSAYLGEKGLSVPHIVWQSDDKKAYIEQDLGNIDLFSIICECKAKQSNLPESVMQIIEKCVYELVDFQLLPFNEWKDLVEFEPLGEDLIDYDINYAVTNFFTVSGVGYDEAALGEEFNILKKVLLNYPSKLKGLMYRDFQSRNIMVECCSDTLELVPYMIDYQSCRMGPGVYDLVSLAWQAKAGFTSVERTRIIDTYINELSQRGVKDAKECVYENLPYWVVFRILQTLGAYGLRGIKERKPHFLSSIPAATQNLIAILSMNEMCKQFPTLMILIKEISKIYK